MKTKLVYFLFLISIFFIFWNLNKDCSILQRTAQYGDEGYWLQNSINKVGSGAPMTDKQSVSFFGAPFYYHIQTLNFSLFGVSILNGRIISILLLLLTALVVFYILNYKIKNKLNCFLYSVLFLLLFDNKIYYQWATPLPLEIFFQSLLLLFLIKTSLIDKWKVIVGAILIYLCILSKTSSIWLIGFILVLYIYENQKFLKLKTLLLINIYYLIPYVLITQYFNIIEPEKYSIFSEFLKNKIGFDIDFFNNFLNPIYFLEQLSGILKFPNSLFLLMMPLVGIVLVLYKKIQLRKIHIVLILYLAVFIVFLIVIGQFGYDRRQVNLILPMFLLSILFYDSYKSVRLDLNQKLIIGGLFLIVLIIQIKHLYSYIFMLDTSKELRQYVIQLDIWNKILTMSLISGIILMACWLFYKYRMKFLFYSFIVLNLVFHVLFFNNKNSLLEGSKKIQELAVQYDAKEITGVNAHQLAIEANLFPIWWLKNNKDFPNYTDSIVLVKNPLIVITDMNKNEKSDYYQIKDHEILKQDTLFLHWNKFLRVYRDTLLINVIL